MTSGVDVVTIQGVEAMARTNHMGCPRGRYVCLVLRDGRRLFGRFHSKTDRHVFLDGLKVATAAIRAFLLLKGGPANSGPSHPSPEGVSP